MAGKTIAVQRVMALGDVLMTTPILRELKKRNPESEITFVTAYGNVFQHNPHVSKLLPPEAPAACEELHNLDLCYERTPDRHIIDSYAQQVFGTTDIDKSTELFVSEKEAAVARQFLADDHLKKGKYITLHMGVTAQNRTFAPGFWEQVTQGIAKLGYKTAVVGSLRDMFAPVNGMVDFRGFLPLHQTATVIADSACFLGSDSGMVHVAGTTETPIVGLFTAAKGEWRVPYRHGELGWRVTTMRTPLHCYGCLKDEPPPVVQNFCSRKDYACLLSIDADDVIEAVRSYLKEGV